VRPPRPLRGLGTAAAARGRGPRRLQVAPLDDRVRASAHALARWRGRAAQLRATRPRRAARPRRACELLDGGRKGRGSAQNKWAHQGLRRIRRADEAFGLSAVTKSIVLAGTGPRCGQQMHGWILDIERTANNPTTASRSCCTPSSRSPRPAGRSAVTTSRDHILDDITLHWLANTAARPRACTGKRTKHRCHGRPFAA
jgi:hypothetical protein